MNESTDYLSLSEYSNRYHISVSTLRRKIKTGQIDFKLVHGKYYLPKQQQNENSQLSDFMPVPSFKKAYKERGGLSDQGQTGDFLFMFGEIKKVYEQSLHDKDQQIIQLKQQVADLKTLVMYLEREIRRRKANFSQTQI